MNAGDSNKRGLAAGEAAGEAEGKTPNEHIIQDSAALVNPCAGPADGSDLDLSESGIDAATAKRCGLYRATATAINKLLGRSDVIGPGLVIPYADPFTGRPLTTPEGARFVRVRLDRPHLTGVQAKGAKYLSRGGGGQQPYFPAIAFDIFRGEPETLFITEGEKKAICACCRGFPCIGVGGNWGWKSRKKMTILPLLRQVLITADEICLIWDSDAALNPSFAISTRLFHQALRGIGVGLTVIVLPQLGSEESHEDRT